MLTRRDFFKRAFQAGALAAAATLGYKSFDDEPEELEGDLLAAMDELYGAIEFEEGVGPQYIWTSEKGLELYKRALADAIESTEPIDMERPCSFYGIPVHAHEHAQGDDIYMVSPNAMYAMPEQSAPWRLPMPRLVR